MTLLLIDLYITYENAPGSSTLTRFGMSKVKSSTTNILSNIILGIAEKLEYWDVISVRLNRSKV